MVLKVLGYRHMVTAYLERSHLLALEMGPLQKMNRGSPYFNYSVNMQDFVSSLYLNVKKMN